LKTRKAFLDYYSIEGENTVNSQNLPLDTTALLEEIGGEPLTGSGFEAEAPEPGYAEDQPPGDNVRRTG
jgi:hypothetical protein